MKKNLLFALLLLPSLMSARGHGGNDLNNNVSLKLNPLSVGEVRLGYERSTFEKQSVKLTLGMLIPTTIPTYFKEDNTTDLGGAELTTKTTNRLTGFHADAEYRFYTGSDKSALNGFYVAPFLTFNNYSVEVSSNYEYKLTSKEFIELAAEYKPLLTQYGVNDNRLNINTSFTGTFRSFGGGAGIGYQWVIGNHFTIDWNFIGLGVQSSALIFDAKSNTYPVNYTQWEGEIESQIKDQNSEEIPFIGNPSEKMTVTADAEKVRVKIAPIVLPVLRGSLSIGFRF